MPESPYSDRGQWAKAEESGKPGYNLPVATGTELSSVLEIATKQEDDLDMKPLARFNHAKFPSEARAQAEGARRMAATTGSMLPKAEQGMKREEPKPSSKVVSRFKPAKRPREDMGKSVVSSPGPVSNDPGREEHLPPKWYQDILLVLGEIRDESWKLRMRVEQLSDRIESIGDAIKPECEDCFEKASRCKCIAPGTSQDQYAGLGDREY